MPNWEPAGKGLEAKLTNSGKILIRKAGQTSEYPHFTLKINNGKLDWEESPSKGGERFGRDEVINIAMTYLRGKGML
jgi:hypothetical protein